MATERQASDRAYGQELVTEEELRWFEVWKAEDGSIHSRPASQHDITNLLVWGHGAIVGTIGWKHEDDQ